MPAESIPDLQLEIAHLLFIDVVAYSRLLVNEQIETMQQLNRIVRATETFRAAEAKDRLIRLPSGDGMALIFFDNPEQPVRCALEIAEKLRDSPEIQVRMGIHSGPVNQITDVNDRLNIAGAGINVAQRVLDCGDAGHILLSKHIADDLAQYRHWGPYLHDLGECEVKHGLRLHVFSLCKDGAGNLDRPQKFKLAKRWKKAGPVPLPNRDRLWIIAAVGLVIAAAGALGVYWLWHSLAGRPQSFEQIIPSKSIAVLPFENLGEQGEYSFLADGVQDEILTNLAKVADLKVISRTSVMQYKGGLKRNIREIAKALGVAHVLEGTVQRANGRVRVNAQLIDARTDTHVWAEKYDRSLADVFAIESELAEKIADQLKSKISPEEKAAIEEQPTADLAAFDLYTRAKKLIEASAITLPQEESLVEAIRLLTQVTQRDPNFALAYYQLAIAHDRLYFVGIDHTPTRLAMAETAIQAFTRSRPNSGEAHLARAGHLYWVYHDYDHARQEIALAQKSLPNDPIPPLLAGYIDRRQSRWDESIKNLKRAIEVDPQNPIKVEQLARTYQLLRRYADAAQAFDHALAINLNDVSMRASRAEVELQWHADPQPLRSTIQTILTEDAGAAKNIADIWLQLAQCQRDLDSAQRALSVLPNDACRVETVPFPRGWCEGLVALMRGDKQAANAAFTAARDETAKLMRDQPDYAEALCVLGMADAFLGHKDAAIREGRRALELLPVTKDSVGGSLVLQYLAIIYAWAGEKDLALQQLAIAVRTPGFLNYGHLRFHPYWDPLRGDPRFDQMVASLAPK